jgi:hypothetical protein
MSGLLDDFAVREFTTTRADGLCMLLYERTGRARQVVLDRVINGSCHLLDCLRREAFQPAPRNG